MGGKGLAHIRKLSWADGDPARHAAESATCMEAKACSKSSDRAFSVAKYRRIFQDVFGAASRLDFSFRGWGDEEARQLANAMMHFECLKCLYLNWNHIGDD